MNTKNTTKNQMYNRGAVSLFVVIFTSLLFVTITVGFTVLMLSNQQQSSDNDLAQSALDSAHAGTEDAKRVLAQLADCEERGLVDTDIDCGRIKDAVFSHECNTVNRALGSTDESERLVRQSENDEKLAQAYTCVKINTETDSYLGKTKGEDEIRVIPLRATGSFDRVRVSWLIADDMDEDEELELEWPIYTNPDGEDESGTPEPDTTRFPTKAEWLSDNRGAVLRVQTMQYEPGDVELDELDKSQRTVFLYPNDDINSYGPPGESVIDLNLADRHQPITPDERAWDGASSVNKPALVECDEATTGYMCSTEIILPESTSDHFAYLTLASFYRETSFKVELVDSGSGDIVNFNNVQPEIDVTGRANDVFRRIVSRVEGADANQAPYPRAELGVGSSVCKDFVVTDDPGDFRDYAYTGHTEDCPNLEAPPI